MEVKPGEANARSTVTILVTGANSGLGFATCCRLIDEFLYTRPQSQTLHLLFSTRDARKSKDTLGRLQAHLQKTLRNANGKTLGISLLLEGRVKIEGVLVDLLKFSTVKALAEQLVRRGEHLDAVIWNAGIANWNGLNWSMAIWTILTDLVHATTYPNYCLYNVGTLAAPQSSKTAVGSNDPEPPLGQIFAANVFGHYLLTHWLRPIMHSKTRIIWTSSISAVPDTFTLSDIQGLKAVMSYEGSKRLTDYIVLTSGLPSTKASVSTFLPAKAAEERPKMYVTHPGVVGTSIAGLNWFLTFWMGAAFVLSRLCGSPWHGVSAYKGAVSAVFVALAPEARVVDVEAREGKVKWGSAVDRAGNERPAKTEVEGWGYCGRVGVVPEGSVTDSVSQFRKRKETTKESREEFEEAGRTIWREMEELRTAWEGRLGLVAQDASIDV